MFCNKKKEEPKQENWIEALNKRAILYAEKYKAGTQVVAENKKGIWKKGKVIGEHSVSLFHLYSIVEFDDGEIQKVSECSISLLTTAQA